MKHSFLLLILTSCSYLHTAERFSTPEQQIADTRARIMRLEKEMVTVSCQEEALLLQQSTLLQRQLHSTLEIEGLKQTVCILEGQSDRYAKQLAGLQNQLELQKTNLAVLTEKASRGNPQRSSENS